MTSTEQDRNRERREELLREWRRALRNGERVRIRRAIDTRRREHTAPRCREWQGWAHGERSGYRRATPHEIVENEGRSQS